MTLTAEVLGLFVYPIKGCKPVALNEAELTPQGFRFDRQWMVVSDSGRFQTQRDNPLLCQVQTAFQDDMLVLSRPGHGSTQFSLAVPAGLADERPAQTVKVWKDECETVSINEEAARWLSQAVESSKPLKIVMMAPGFTRLQSHPERLGAETHVNFADASPYLIVNESSLDRLNQTLLEKGELAVPADRFRGNILVRGLDPFTEHELMSLENGTCRFELRTPCERCVVTTIDQETAIKHPRKEPFVTLRDLNPSEPNGNQPAFGQYATLKSGAGSKIAIGNVLKASD